MKASSQGAITSPAASRRKPQMRATARTVWTASEIRLLSPLPIREAIRTFAPMERPIKRPIRRLIRGALLPTAAMASLELNFPTTARSVAVKSCCRMLVAAMGRAKKISLSQSEPCSISISFFIRHLISSRQILQYFCSLPIVYQKKEAVTSAAQRSENPQVLTFVSETDRIYFAC